MLNVRVNDNSLYFGSQFSISFQRTLRIPDDGTLYPLPPGLGRFPIFRVNDYADRVPSAWRERGGVFIPMYQREALWICFDGVESYPVAVKVGIGKINAVSGKPWNNTLDDDPQDYIVAPTQPWIDGIKAGEGYVKQFVAMPLGMGYTVEAQLSGKEDVGGIQLLTYAPKTEKLAQIRKRLHRRSHPEFGAVMCCYSRVSEIGIAAGGRMSQKIYPDEYGIDTWDPANSGRVFVHIVDSLSFREITGQEPPPTPVSAQMYSQYGFPWFELYDEAKGDLQPGKTFSPVKSVKEIDQHHGFSPQQNDNGIVLTPSQVKKLSHDESLVEDGTW